MAQAAERLGPRPRATVAIDKRRSHLGSPSPAHRARRISGRTRRRRVLEFDADGTFLRAWGGPGTGFDWPDSEHGIFVDYKDNVWIGGSSPTSQSLTRRSDDMLLKFTHQRQVPASNRRARQEQGQRRHQDVNKPADAFVDPKTNELFVADGYGNRRLIVFDADTGAFKRMWGAFGNAAACDCPRACIRYGADAARRGAGAPALDTDGPGRSSSAAPSTA